MDNWRPLAAALALSLAGLSPCCSRSSSPKAAATPAAVYTVRGRVASLPEAGKPASEFRVQHEAIDNFVGVDGKLGMKSMTMAFPSRDVSLEGLAVGDVIELTFEVNWMNQPRMKTTKIVKLPHDTVLNLGKGG